MVIFEQIIYIIFQDFQDKDHRRFLNEIV